LIDEKRHNLLRNVAKHSEEHEDGKHLVLQSLEAVVRFVERETSEERLIKSG
jgi:hypothetical protein